MADDLGQSFLFTDEERQQLENLGVGARSGSEITLVEANEVAEFERLTALQREMVRNMTGRPIEEARAAVQILVSVPGFEGEPTEEMKAIQLQAAANILEAELDMHNSINAMQDGQTIARQAWDSMGADVRATGQTRPDPEEAQRVENMIRTGESSKEAAARISREIDELVQGIDAATRDIKVAQDALSIALISGRPDRAVALENQIVASQAKLRELQAQKLAKVGVWEQRVATWKKFEDQYKTYIQSIRDYKGSEAFAGLDAKILNKLADSADLYLGPIQRVSSKLRNVTRRINTRYQAAVEALVDSGEVIPFYEDVFRAVDKESKVQVKRMEAQVKELETIVNDTSLEREAMAEAVYKATSRFMSPSYRLYMATLDDFNEIKRLVKIDWSLFIMPFRIAAYTIRAGARIGAAAAFRGAELVIGEEAAGKIADTGLAVFEFVGELAAATLTVEVQAAVMAGSMVRDFIHDRGNLHYFAEDALSYFLPASIIDKFDSLKLAEFPEFSRNVGTAKTPSALRALEMDNRLMAYTLDFWGDKFITEINKRGYKYPAYRKLKAFRQMRRIPGRYIDPKNHPFDGEAELQRCIELEKSLDLGDLVDERGILSNNDRGGNIMSNVYPRKKGLVRNLVSFPMFDTSARYPPRTGLDVQIGGHFAEADVDPTIAALFKGWVNAGTWGPAYNLSKDADTRKRAAQTNKRDLRNWLNPTMDFETAWIDVREWLKTNRGKRKVMETSMFKLQEDVFMKEYNSDGEDRFNYGGDPGTLEFVQGFKEKHGRYPIDKTSRDFYTDVFQNGIVRIMNPFPGTPFRPETTREPHAGEAAFYKGVSDSIERYRLALIKTQGDAEKAWTEFNRKTVWDAYIADTKSQRTIWGYVRRFKQYLVGELVAYVHTLVNDAWSNLWERYMKRINGSGVPLTTNSFHRVSFMARFAKLVYSKEQHSAVRVRKEIEKKTGPFLENRLVTTGITHDERSSWAEETIETIIQAGKHDWPVFFGNLHCRLIVFPNPQPTLVVAFRGTTNAFEWLVDLDFSGALYGSVVSGSKPGTFRLDMKSEKETPFGEIEKILFKDPHHFGIHRGFLRAWTALRPEVEKAILEIFANHQIENYVVTGHSLGAAITQVACLELPSLPRRKKGTLFFAGKDRSVTYVRPHAYMFSSPGVGDRRFSFKFLEQVSESVQTWVDGDMVTTVPPFLIPDQGTWGTQYKAATTWVQTLTASEIGPWATAVKVAGNVFDSFHIPKILNPNVWTKNGKFDKEKAMGNVELIARSSASHRAWRGAGIYYRLDAASPGDMVEQPHEFGNSEWGFAQLIKGNTGPNRLRQLHNIDTVIHLSDLVAQKHPDIFSATSTRMPEWNRGRISTLDNKKKVNGSIPSPELTYLMQQPGVHVIGLVSTDRPYRPGMVVNKDHILPGSIIMVTDPNPQERKRKRQRQARRRKIRKTTEGDYHGY